MLRLFKKRAKVLDTSSSLVAEPIVESEPIVEVIESVPTVAEIHQTFFTEVDKLLEEARIFRTIEINDPIVYEKGKRLVDLGFTSAKTVAESVKEQKRLDKLHKENEEKKLLADAIEYFGTKYPLYRFITMTSINRICDKYGLKHGKVHLYEGEVPDKNLLEIENAKIDEEDRVYSADSEYSSKKTFMSKKDYERHKNTNYDHRQYYNWDILGLIIAAPRKDFRANAQELDNEIVEKPAPLDPIVMMPVIFMTKVFYLIISAWGDEAGDPDVVNKILN